MDLAYIQPIETQNRNDTVNNLINETIQHAVNVTRDVTALEALLNLMIASPHCVSPDDQCSVADAIDEITQSN